MFQHLFLIALVFPLEWNSTYRTDVPYEVDVNPAKLGAKTFTVVADGKPLATEQFKGKLPGNVTLRFSVPEGVKGLRVKGVPTDGDAHCPSKPTTDHQPLTTDLFSVAFADLKGWALPKGVKAVQEGDGILFVGGEKMSSSAIVSYTVDLPEGAGGKPVMQDIEVANRGKLVWGGMTFIEQIDAKGNTLPETLADRRWTTHMRPVDKVCTYRDEGHVHPKARRLRFCAELRRLESPYDAYGLPVRDKAILLPRLHLTRLGVRFAAQLPFPKWNDGFFGEGVSGESGDASFRMGGETGHSFAYQLRSRACWTQKHQFRNEQDIYFPAGAGTVEAWLKPDWKAFLARRRAENPKSKRKAQAVPAVLFDAYQSYIAAECKKGMGSMMKLAYLPATKRLSLLLRDWKGTLYTKDFDGVEIPEGVWSHVAVQWRPQDAAEVFIGGACVAKMPILEYQAIPLTDKSIKNVNDRGAMEFFFGTDFASGRKRGNKEKLVGPSGVFFEGEADNLRVSTGCRYVAGFTPAKTFALDADTRALFTFDRAFDGVSGGGFGFIPGTVRAAEDRVDHVVKGGIQYYPKEILPENDPAKVFDIVNYPVLPDEQEFREARALRTKTVMASPGDVIRFTAAKKAYPDFVSFENLSKTEPLLYPIVVGKGELDPRSFGDLADSLATVGLSDRERVNRVFQYGIDASDYFSSHQTCFQPGSDIPCSACYEAMLTLNSYCGFNCGPLNNIVANMLPTVAGCPAGQTAGYGHEFQQAFFDGKNHIYDLSAQKFFPAMDNETSAYLKEVGDQPCITRRYEKSVDHYMRQGSRGSWVQNPSYQEKVGMIVNPGETLRILYRNDGHFNNLHTASKKGVYGWKTPGPESFDYAKAAGADDSGTWAVRRDRIFPDHSTALVTFEGRPTKENPAFGDFTADSFVYRVTSGYPIVFGCYAARLASGGSAALEISSDGGRTFSPIAADAEGRAALEYRVKGRRAYLIRVKAPLASVASFSARTSCQVNRRTYPGWVKPGENEFVVKGERVKGERVKGDAVKVTFGWREPVKDIIIAGAVRSGTIPGCERELVCFEPTATPTYEVSGLSAKAKAVTVGRVKATLADGRLTLAYDGSRAPAWRHGGDVPETRTEFPSVSAVRIIDGEAEKMLTVIVAPNARLARADDPVMAKEKTLSFEKLPAGTYAVFTLARFAARPKVGMISLVDPSKKNKPVGAARSINPFMEYLKAPYGREGQRARWKWDVPMRTDLQAWAGGHIMGFVDIPEGTDHLDYVCGASDDEKVELSAALILPEPNLEARLELRHLLFGYNSDPFQN